MAITKDKKKEILSNLKDIFAKSKSVVFLNFHGLGVEDTTTMRRQLKTDGVGYYVAKKSLAKKALSETPFEGEIPELVGEMAFAYSDDETGSARGVYEFQKKFKDGIKIVGGVFENKYMDEVKMTEIAQIPSLHVLRGQFVNIINSPIQQFVVSLSEIAKSRE